MATKCWLWILLCLLCLLPACTPLPESSPDPVALPPTTVSHPTMEPRLWQTGSEPRTVLALPGTIYHLDLAVHPTDHWPVVGAMHRLGISTDPIQIYVRVFDPTTAAWGVAQQIDVGPSSAGQDRFGKVVVGVTGDDTILAVWGASDDAAASLWTSESTDYGTTWSPPTQIATQCWFPNDMATTPDGQAVVQASCYSRQGDQPIPVATMLLRRADGTWLPQQAVDVPGWFGAVAIAGDGRDAFATAWVTAKGQGYDEQTIYLIQKYLVNEQAGWQVATRQLQHPRIPADAWGDSHWNPRALSFTRFLPTGDVTTGITFMWTGQYRTSAYAMTSFDGGMTWGAAEPIVWYPRPDRETGHYTRHVAPAYDPGADRLVSVWTCCQDGWRREPATHYASWSVPHTGVWMPTQGPDQYLETPPLLLGSRAAHETATAQSPGSRTTWVAWIEQQQSVVIRTLDLNQVIPVSEYGHDDE